MRLSYLLTLILVCCLSSAQAEETTSHLVNGTTASEELDFPDTNHSPFWITIKTKLVKHLNNVVDKSKYSYKIIGPANPMDHFLGNFPDADIVFEKLNIASPSKKKSIIATALDENGKKLESITIWLDFTTYRQVYMLHKPVYRGQEIGINNVYLAKVPVDPANSRLYFDGNPAQKIANINISAGQPLTVTMLRHEKLIKSGDMLKIKSGSNRVQVEFMCRAVGNADIGETLSVSCPGMVPQTRKAQVIDKTNANLL